jgi:hypothetical protein
MWGIVSFIQGFIFIKIIIMFGWLKQKKPLVPVINTVFMRVSGKNKRLLSLAVQNPQPVFVCWFEASANSLKLFFEAQGLPDVRVILPREAAGIHGAPFIFCEHHPSYITEQERFLNWGLVSATVITSLDEALFKSFGGNRIVDLMKQMGMHEDEPITHPMVNAAIKNAQEKVDKKFKGIEQNARSQEDWLAKHGV